MAKLQDGDGGFALRSAFVSSNTQAKNRLICTLLISTKSAASACAVEHPNNGTLAASSSVVRVQLND